jgi:hypothetical protein
VTTPDPAMTPTERDRQLMQAISGTARPKPWGQAVSKHECRGFQVYVIQRKGNASAFNGYRWQRSAYSAVACRCCGRVWRTKAAFVDRSPDAPPGWYDAPGGPTRTRCDGHSPGTTFIYAKTTPFLEKDREYMQNLPRDVITG